GIAKLQDLVQNNYILNLRNLTSSALCGSPRLIICDRVEVDEWRSDGVALFRTASEQNSLQPVFFNRYDEVPARAKLLLAFRAELVGTVIGVMPTRGQIVYGTQFSRTTVFLPQLINKVQAAIKNITSLKTQKAPPLFLCSHCEICEFRTRCASRAVD